MIWCSILLVVALILAVIKIVSSRFVVFPASVTVPVFHLEIMKNPEFKDCIDYLEAHTKFNSNCLYVTFKYKSNPNEESNLFLTKKDLYNIKLSQIFTSPDENNYDKKPRSGDRVGGRTFWKKPNHGWSVQWRFVYEPSLNELRECWIETYDLNDIVCKCSNQRVKALKSLSRSVNSIKDQTYKESISKTLKWILRSGTLKNEEDELEKI